MYQWNIDNFCQQTWHNSNVFWCNLNKLQQATEKTDNIFDGIIESIFWVGPYFDIHSRLSKVPGLIMNNSNDNPCIQYEHQPQYNKSVTLFFRIFYR